MRSDVVVIGAGHNGLAAAAYLARAGLRTEVLERRSVLGGACVTEELWPGYRVSRAAYVVGLLRPALVRELALERRGLRLLPRDPSSFTPLAEGGGLLLGPDRRASRASIAAFSARDAAAWPLYEDWIDRIARAVEPLLDRTPPDPARLRARDLPAWWALLRGGLRLRADLARALPLLLGPARPVLESWFESEPLRATLASDAVIGAFAPPSAPGTGYVLLHHVMGRVGPARGVWAYVEGGMGRLSEALADAAREAGAQIRLDAPVARIALRDGRAVGVELEDGSLVEARAVVSGADPHRTCFGLLGREALPEDFARQLDGLDFRSGSLKINLALSRLPRFRGASQDPPGPEHRGTIHLGASHLDDLERAFEAAARGALPERPMVELTLPSALDPTLAPPGHHVASLFVQYAPFEPADGGWAAQREPFADRVLGLVDEVAPGFTASVLEREVLAPPDLERVFGLTGGNLFHGAMAPWSLGPARPVPGFARYRTPVPGLYLCGAGTHPGGGVMGACGRNAAREILGDLR